LAPVVLERSSAGIAVVRQNILGAKRALDNGLRLETVRLGEKGWRHGSRFTTEHDRGRSGERRRQRHRRQQRGREEDDATGRSRMFGWFEAAGIIGAQEVQATQEAGCAGATLRLW